MLTRLKVCGFKNLVDVDVRFGPFTCIAGPNAVGKSNLFDVISFLSHLADSTLVDAALALRGGSRRLTDVKSLFHTVGDYTTDLISITAEMIVPREGVDDLGQKAEASTTYLRYRLDIRLRAEDEPNSMSSLELMRESLDHIRLSDAPRNLFQHRPVWRDGALRGARRGAPFISTEGSGQARIVRLHQDQRQGRPYSRAAADMPRTVLSAANSAESPTALLARREMQSWRLLQLEPSSLRTPDELTAPQRVGSDGSHIAAALYRLSRECSQRLTQQPSGGDVCAQLAVRLAQLIDDVDAVYVEKDETRELLTLYVRDRSGTIYPARALSDGTLRFLALAVIDQDTQSQGVLCLEEPENGIHPERVPAMLQLLQSIATDPEEELGLDNPLRQVIVNTHSPAVVTQVDEDSLLVARSAYPSKGSHQGGVQFGWLPHTWRQARDPEKRTVPLGELLAYLQPIARDAPECGQQTPGSKRRKRVADRTDVQPLLFEPE